MSCFETAVAVVLSHEGGYSMNPKDPGGETKFGISERSYPNLNIRDLTREDAKKIYFTDYWQKMRCDRLPFGVALVLFDFGVNAGKSTAIKAIQRVANVKADGVLGDRTLSAVLVLDRAYVIENFTAERIMHYTALDTFKTFGRGWINRSVETMATALLAREYNV